MAPPPGAGLAPTMEVALLIFLTFINALFAMSEMALASSRKARLQVMVESGSDAAKVAMAMRVGIEALAMCGVSTTFWNWYSGESMGSGSG